MDYPQETVCLFVVAAGDGRRSSEWRVWTAKEGGKATDEVYLAPQTQMVDFKISLHSNGCAQYGVSEAVRAAARPGDRRALLRWELGHTELYPGWTPVYCLQFPDSELAELPVTVASQVVVPASAVGMALVVIIMISDAAVALPGNLPEHVIGMLDRKNGGRVAIFATEVPFDPDILAEVDSPLDELTPWAILGTEAAPEPYGWIVHRGLDGTRRSTEFNSDLRAPGQQPLSLPQFPGVVQPWGERPADVNDRGLACAVLVCPASDQPQLFVDTRARCTHGHLERDATDLVVAHKQGQRDHGWGQLPNGDYYTCISIPRVLAESGGMAPGQWSPGPGQIGGREAPHR